MINQFWTCFNRFSGWDADTFSAKAPWHASSFGLLICRKLLIWPFYSFNSFYLYLQRREAGGSGRFFLSFHRMLRAGEAASSSTSSTSSTCACSGGPWLPPAPTRDWHWASELTQVHQVIKWHQMTSRQDSDKKRCWTGWGPLQNSFRALVCSASLRMFKYVQTCSGKFFVGGRRGRRPISSVGPKNFTFGAWSFLCLARDLQPYCMYIL